MGQKAIIVFFTNYKTKEESNLDVSLVDLSRINNTPFSPCLP